MYFCICVCVRMCARPHMCVCVSVGGWVCVWFGEEGMSVGAPACACTRVALIMQHAMHHYIVICNLSGSTTFFGFTS
jgi:hypothetical protein